MVRKIDQPESWESLMQRVTEYRLKCKHKRDYDKNMAIMLICVVHHEISIAKLLRLKISDFLDETTIVQSLESTCFEALSNYVTRGHPTPKDRDSSLFGFKSVCSVTNMMFNIIGCSTNRIKRLYNEYVYKENLTSE